MKKILAQALKRYYGWKSVYIKDYVIDGAVCTVVLWVDASQQHEISIKFNIWDMLEFFVETTTTKIILDKDIKTKLSLVINQLSALEKAIPADRERIELHRILRLLRGIGGDQLENSKGLRSVESADQLCLF